VIGDRAIVCIAIAEGEHMSVLMIPSAADGFGEGLSLGGSKGPRKDLLLKSIVVLRLRRCVLGLMCLRDHWICIRLMR
jgi:hypothetical protein